MFDTNAKDVGETTVKYKKKKNDIMVPDYEVTWYLTAIIKYVQLLPSVKRGVVEKVFAAETDGTRF